MRNYDATVAEYVQLSLSRHSVKENLLPVYEAPKYVNANMEYATITGISTHYHYDNYIFYIF